jgi:4-hydroxy-3-polyprenylbenzoate decarboxylase
MTMAYYKDIRELIAALENARLLVRIDREINKDTQLHPLVRLQFRGLPEAERKAFLFTNVIDVSGRRYDIPIVIACLAGSRQIYGVGLQCDPDKISQRWTDARSHPIEPIFVENAPVQEVVQMGADLDKPGHGPTHRYRYRAKKLWKTRFLCGNSWSCRRSTCARRGMATSWVGGRKQI